MAMLPSLVNETDTIDVLCRFRLCTTAPRELFDITKIDEIFSNHL